jgi:hypothetical protein
MAVSFKLQASMQGNGVLEIQGFNPKTEDRVGEAGLLVYTEERKVKAFTPGVLLNSEFGIALNQNGAFSGTPDPVHDGIDSVLWTGTEPVGTKVTFDSTDRAFAGTKSVKINAPSNADIWQFDKGSDLTVASFTAITMKINIDKDWSAGDSVSFYGYDTGTGLQVGVKVLIEEYISIVAFDVWQSVTIPLSDLAMTGTIDAFRMEQEAKTGPAPVWYLDNFQVEESGEPIKFRFEPRSDQIFHVTRLAAFVVNDATTEAQLQAYDKFYAETALANGVGITIQSKGSIVLNFTERTLESQITQPQISIDTGGDGTNSWIKVMSDIEFDLDGRKRDFIEYSVRDDLTALETYNVWFFGWGEDI